MKTNINHILATLFLVGIIATNCKKDEMNDLIEENGLSRDINDFIPQDILDILDSLDMPINTGGNPANIEGTFLMNPSILMSSNIETDIIGFEFNELLISFFEQNNDELTITTQYVEEDASQEGEGYGSFLVGEGNDFSVFAKNMTYDTFDNDSALNTIIFTGTIGEEGIEDLHVAVVMLNDFGDPNNQYIEIGDSRVLYDEDAISERTEEFKSIQKKMQQDISEEDSRRGMVESDKKKGREL
ncbi:hypothetical protein SAMN05444280_107100 [Tangfeifania diversioriginum]|uniref:Uncharacterized protein n=1 Tax=Tangfeifania diversioriginum TaxID=1168035 RepID=A0A1M6ESD2_9BACT|nr:hypothetical protein [Tangfeifania diversioriginum]SHI88279.1 hypothetical protein SAMN05444280_107100 [Tangfeifania diversioriginum]